MAIIYRALDITNGMSYIGQTWSSLKKRKNAHLIAKKKYHFHNALHIRPEKFIWSVLAETDTQEELDALENKFVSLLNTLHPNGYNLQDGGQGCGRPCDETRNKMSVSHKGKKYKPMSEQGKKNLSVAHMGQISHWKGKTMSAEYRAKLSKAKLGKKHSDETRAKMSASRMGRVFSEETRRKLSEANKRRWQHKRENQ